MTEEREDFADEQDSLLDALAGTPDGSVLPRQSVIDGQYRIERVIGEGGMGVVHLARDLRLGRDVAIKLGIERSAATVGKLAREALALARLSHPNVVVIYQVGEVGGRAYVAMEYVAGGTARTWCEGRGWRDVIGLYIAAGEGLAAAHASGLVHRDFKPDNVLVGADGRPRVADFGLASEMTEPTGGAMGTPAYMAPEQVAGEEVDARADQYAFCTSVWEALFGVRAPERATRRVPAHLELALRRGLKPAREDRWASMAPLLAELRREPWRRRFVAIGALALAATAAVGVVLSRQASDDPCSGGATELAATWTTSRSAQVHATIAPLGAAPWKTLSAGRTVDAIDGWARRWIVQHRAVCLASRGEWTPALAERGTDCLSRSRRELATRIEMLLATPALAASAEALFTGLDAPERCADASYIAAAVAPPADTATAARTRDEQGELSKVAAMDIGGQFTAARDLATSVLARVRTVGYGPLTARAEHRLAHALMGVGDFETALASYRDGYYEARKSRDPETAARCAAGASLALLDLSRDGEAADWAHLADVEAQTSADPAIELGALRAVTIVETARNEPKLALADAERFVVIARARGDSDWGAPIDALRARSAARDLLGTYDGALADLDEALRIVTAHYKQHPLLADLERERSLVLLHLHRADDAVAGARRAVAMAESTTGPDSREANNALAVLGTCLKDAKSYEEALVVLRHSVALTKLNDGPRSYNAASDLNNLGDLLALTKKLDEALATWVESRSIFVEVVGEDGSEVGIVDGNVANAYIDAGRVVDGYDAAKSALAITGKSPDSPIHAQALIAVGMAEVERGDGARGKAHLTEGLAKLDDDPRWRHRARWYLATLARAAGDIAGARALATQALTDARLADAPDATAKIEQLLARLR